MCDFYFVVAVLIDFKLIFWFSEWHHRLYNVHSLTLPPCLDCRISSVDWHFESRKFRQTGRANMSLYSPRIHLLIMLPFSLLFAFSLNVFIIYGRIQSRTRNWGCIWFLLTSFKKKSHKKAFYLLERLLQLVVT